MIEGMYHGTGMYRKEGRLSVRVTGCQCRARVKRGGGVSQRCANVMEVGTTQWIAVDRTRSMSGPGMRPLSACDPVPIWR